MSRYMESRYSGECEAASCLAPSRKIRKGEKIYWNSDLKRAYHAQCHELNLRFDQVVNAIANTSGVVRVLDDEENNRKYVAGHNLLRSAILSRVSEHADDPEYLRVLAETDLACILDDARDMIPRPDREVLAATANVLLRAGLQCAVNTGELGHVDCLEFYLNPWFIPIRTDIANASREKHEVTVYFTNTWGGDDGFSREYRVYCTHKVTGPDYLHEYVLDQWARDIVSDAGILPCSISESAQEFTGYVLEVVGAIRSHGAVEGIPCENYAAKDPATAFVRALHTVRDAKYCTSDDPTNHQGDTCPVHESDAGTSPVNDAIQIIRQSLDVIRKRTASERVQREADVIEAQIHQMEMLS